MITEVDRNGRGEAPPIFEAEDIERAVQNVIHLDRYNDHVATIAAFMKSGLPTAMLPDYMKLSFANQRIYCGARLGNIGSAFGGAVLAKTRPRNEAEIAILPRHGNVPATTTTAHAHPGRPSFIHHHSVIAVNHVLSIKWHGVPLAVVVSIVKKPTLPMHAVLTELS